MLVSIGKVKDGYPTFACTAGFKLATRLLGWQLKRSLTDCCGGGIIDREAGSIVASRWYAHIDPLCGEADNTWLGRRTGRPPVNAPVTVNLVPRVAG